MTTCKIILTPTTKEPKICHALDTTSAINLELCRIFCTFSTSSMIHHPSSIIHHPLSIIIIVQGHCKPKDFFVFSKKFSLTHRALQMLTKGKQSSFHNSSIQNEQNNEKNCLYPTYCSDLNSTMQ